jgi:hypothetical protein
MAFDVKELMIDITKVGAQMVCNPTACYASGGGCYASGGGCYASGGGCYASGGGCYASGGGCYASGGGCYASGGCNPTVICRPTIHCLCTLNCTYLLTHCTPSILPCKFGTYTCLDTRLTCGGTIYCAGTENRPILYQGIERESLAEVKAQLNAALKEIEQHESRVAEEEKESKKK